MRAPYAHSVHFSPLGYKARRGYGISASVPKVISHWSYLAETALTGARPCPVTPSPPSSPFWMAQNMLKLLQLILTCLLFLLASSIRNNVARQGHSSTKRTRLSRILRCDGGYFKCCLLIVLVVAYMRDALATRSVNDVGADTNRGV